MTSIDVNEAAADEVPELEALLTENRSLRAYLKRVIGMLETRIDEVSHPVDAVDHAQPGLRVVEEPVRLAELEAQLARIEEDVQTVLWLLSEPEEAAVTAVD